MQPLTQQKLAANAYRTLGLSAGAGQASIEAAARRMRIWPDERRIPPTPWDLPALGPIARTRGDLQQALAALTEPASRAEERLLWYLAPTLPAAAEPAAPPEGQGETYPPDRRHDAALAALHAAWAADPDVSDPPRWESVLQQLDELATAHDFPAWLTRAEADGDFEKRAAPDEIRGALRALPAALAAALVPRAEAALDRGDVAACAGIVSVLRAANPGGGGPLSGAVRALLDRLEDGLAADCREIGREVRDKLRTHPDCPEHFFEANALAAHYAATAYKARVRPALERLQTLAPDDPQRLLRCRSCVGELLGLVGIGWEWAGKFDKAELTLAAALELAEGTQAEPAIRRDYERCRALAEKARAPRQPPPFVVTDNTFAYNETQTGYYDTDDSSKRHNRGSGALAAQQAVSGYGTTERSASKGAGMGWVAIMLGIGLVRGIMALVSETSHGTPYDPTWTPSPKVEQLRLEQLLRRPTLSSPGTTREPFAPVLPTPRRNWTNPSASDFKLPPSGSDFTLTTPAPPPRNPTPVPAYPGSPNYGTSPSAPGGGSKRGP